MNLQKIVTGQYVELSKMLDARERRQFVQQKLLNEHQFPLISFTLNIVGPIKVFPLAIRTFEEGLSMIRTQCMAWKLPIIEEKRIEDITGYEAFLVIDSDARTVKEILCRLEERTPLGRLFDLDVLSPDGTKISRTDFHMPPHKCLLCNQDAFVCSRSRPHSVDEILTRACEIMEDYFHHQYAHQISSLAMASLLYEVAATPKPGLVDRDNSGSHKDMDFYTFQSSAVSLNQFFEEFTLCGIKNHERSCEDIFALIRPIGIQAEAVMKQATNGVNTHKGMIFSLGIFCCALGYLYGNDIPYTEASFRDTCRQMTAHILDDFQGITLETAKTHGERLYARYGITGIRGEAADGYPTVFETALPVFRQYRNEGLSANDAGVLTLLHIIAGSVDTNIIARSDYETFRKVQAQIQSMLNSGIDTRDFIAEIRTLDQEFIKMNISPGGSADMLALTYFVASL